MSRAPARTFLVQLFFYSTFLFLAAAGLLHAQNAPSAGSPAPSAGIPVTAGSAQVRDMPVYLYGLGTVQPLNTVQVKAQVNGTLVALPVQEGQEVKKGDIIALIDPRPYKAALDQATAQREQDIAQLGTAQVDLKRYQDLAKRNFAPVQQVDDQQGTVNKLTAAIAMDTAMMETAKINLDYCTIRAPFDGRASFYQVTVGNVIQMANQSNGIMTLVQDKPISVVLTVPATNLAQVQQARQKGLVSITAFDGVSGKQISAGTLLTPNNMIDTSSATISLKATFDNQDGHLWPGLFVNARVQVGVTQNAVTVPDLAVQRGPDGPFIYIIKPDDSVASVPVQIGDSVDGQTIIAKGLKAGESVVVTGQSRLAPGVRVMVKNPAKATAS